MKRMLLFMLLFTITLFCINNQLTAQNALSFDGTNDYVQTNITSLTGNSNRTIEAWIKTSNVTTQRIVVGMGTMPLGTRFTLNVLQSKLRIEIGGGGINSATSVDDGQWHHVAVTYDNAAAQNFKLYVDGVLDASGNITAASVNTAAGTGLAIGRRNDGVNFFNGQIDEVRVWNTVRTQAEISGNMNNELCSNTNQGLVAYYKFNQGAANGNNMGMNTALDDSGNSNSGTLTNFSLTGSLSNWTTGQTLGTTGNSSSSFSATACDSYTAPSGAVYTSSQTVIDVIPNVAGCDSTMTINLTINNSQTITQNVAVCDSFVATNGQVYYTSQTITDTYTNIFGCDSLVVTNLSVNREEAVTSIEVCDSYTLSGQTYTESQIISDTFTNVAGCDSIITINLTINKADTSVNVNNNILTSNATNSFFQWINCDLGVVIGGAMNPTYTATSSGNYALIVTTFDGCIDTTDCISVVIANTEEPILEDINFYPNPNNGQLRIDLGEAFERVEMRLISIDGKELSVNNYRYINHINFDLDVPSGFYFLKIKTEKGVKTIKIQRD